MNAALSDSLVGQVLANKYQVLREIGRGGMGVVYEAEHITLGKRVAIKLMLEKYSEDLEATARFQREALAASRIGNPHIIEVMDFDVAPDGRAFVVMELLSRGAPLSTLLEQRGQLPVWRAIHIMRQVLRAVGAAHAKGIVHRDLKPDNIFLVENDDQQDFVKLLDFGISKMMDTDEAAAATKLTTTGVIIGTPLYMAPEQAMGSRVEHFADLYACGVILYEMLAARPPFEGPNYAVLIAKVLTSEADLLSSVREGLPPKLVAAVHRALEKEPTARFSSAEEFAQALPSNKSNSQLELAGTMESGRRPNAPAVLSTLGASAGAMQAQAVARDTIPPSTTRSKLPLLAGLGLAIVAGAIVGVVLLNRKGNVGTPTALAPSTTLSASPSPSNTQPPTAPEQGQLDIETTPRGAMITVDAQNWGPSPVSVPLLPGSHAITVSMAGYTTMSFMREVRAGAPAALALVLASTEVGSAAGRTPTPTLDSSASAKPHSPAKPEPYQKGKPGTLPATGGHPIGPPSQPQDPKNPYADTDPEAGTDGSDPDTDPAVDPAVRKNPKNGHGKSSTPKSNPYNK